MQEKKELRKRATAIRKSLDIVKISDKIVERILDLEIYKEARHVMIFYPLGHEISLLKLLQESKDKHFYLPKVDGKGLLVCPYKDGDKLILSNFKTEEPTTEPIDTDILDVIFVPALMVDNNFNRLGYGGGFYDRFLSRHAPQAKKIVAISSTLITENLPSESFDAKIDIIVSEKFICKDKLIK